MSIDKIQSKSKRGVVQSSQTTTPHNKTIKTVKNI